MSVALPASGTCRRTSVALACCLIAAYTYFYQGGGWNQNSRFALVRALIEQRTFRIDDTVRFDGKVVTGDLARYCGHVYSDKAPGVALTAVPPVALAYSMLDEPSSREGIAVLSYIATVATAGIPGVVAALLVFHLAWALGSTPGGSVFAAVVYGLGSPAWCYATLFYGHALSAACLVAAFSAAVALRGPSSPRRDRLLALAVGVSGGWATASEYTAVVPAAFIALLAVACARSGDGWRLSRVIACVTGGALVCAGILAIVNTLSFGGPLELGYSNVVGFEGMRQGFFGLTRPNPETMKALLFGQYRGLFFFAPALALAPIGFAVLVRDRSARGPAIAALAIAVYYVLLNASYVYWDGGWSYGPRHMSAAIPYLSLALAPVWSHAARPLRICLFVIALYGAVLTLVAVSTTAQPPDGFQRPVTELLWPHFVKGEIAVNWQSFVEDNLQGKRDPATHAWNVGEKLGLTGLVSLTPLLALWSVTGLAWYTRHRRSAVGPSAGE